MLRHSELEIRSDITTQLVFRMQVLLPGVLTRVTVGKYVAGLACKNDFDQNLLKRM